MEEKALFKVEDILEPLGGRLIHGNPEIGFSNYCIDSRYVDSRTLFVPLMGQSRDGHQFIIDAINKGAVAALVRAGHHHIHEIINWLNEHMRRGGYTELEDVCIIEVRHTLVALQKLAEWFRFQFGAKVIGITGSVGKTGTKEMLIQLLSAKYHTVGTEKNFNNEIGVPLALAKLSPATEIAVIEMAMRARGEISLLSRIAHPDVAMITNTLGSHVGRLGSFHEVVKAKCEIIHGMNEQGTLILNKRDPNILHILKEIENRKEGPEQLDISFFDSGGVYENCGLPQFYAPGQIEEYKEIDHQAEVWVENVRTKGLEGSVFDLCTKDARRQIELNLLGRGAIDNLVAAAAVALSQGLTLDDIAEAAPTLLPAPQRMNLYQLNSKLYLIDDCYNSSPASMRDSLEMMLNIDQRYNRVAVVGDMLELGKFETLLHRQSAQTMLNLPLNAVFAVGPRMNAVNEVESLEDIDLYYLHGRSDFHGFGGGKSPAGFGRDSNQRSSSNTVILDDKSADKLAAMLNQHIKETGAPTVVLIKASRALHLERVVNQLLAEVG